MRREHFASKNGLFGIFGKAGLRLTISSRGKQQYEAVAVTEYKIALLGFGGVNRALAQLVAEKNELWAAELGFTLKIVGVSDIFLGSVIGKDGLDPKAPLQLWKMVALSRPTRRSFVFPVQILLLRPHSPIRLMVSQQPHSVAGLWKRALAL
jgi:hypothetical protein